MSYKVFIVEDDVNFRYAMQEIVPWAENGFEVVGSAVHGVQALEMLEHIYVDVVITDMSMPLMNGIELTRILQERYPEIAVVAFSAYDDFHFVKEAMKNGAKDYILKQDLNPDDVIRVLQRVCKEREDKDREEKARDRYRYYMMRWFTRNETPTGEIREYAASLVADKWVMLAVLLRGDEDLHLHMEGTVSSNVLLQLHDERQNIYILYRVEETSSMQQRRSMEQQAVQALRHSCTGTIGALASRAHRGAEGLDTITQELVGLRGVLPYTSAGVLFYEDYEQAIRTREPDYRYEIPEQLPLDDEAAFREALTAMEESLRAHMPDEEALNDAYIRFYQRAARAGHISEDISGDFVTALNDRRTLADKSAWLTNELRTRREEAGQSYTGGRVEIERAIRYIREHYAEDLTLADVAGHVGLSENYFSNLFKAETGENMTAYVNRIRIERARYYLTHTGMKVYEVSEQVGYKNTTYFSRIFKRYTGQSVADFKGRSGENPDSVKSE